MIRSFFFRNGSDIDERVFYTIPRVGQTFSSKGVNYVIVEVRSSIDMLIVQEI
jgi:hypothetical protein